MAYYEEMGGVEVAPVTAPGSNQEIEMKPHEWVMAKKDGYYILLVQGGTEIDIRGPFDTFEKRDMAAKRLWKQLNPDYDSLFFMDCKQGEKVVVGPYADLED